MSLSKELRYSLDDISHLQEGEMDRMKRINRDIRLVALDLDGTTFNSKKEITQRTRSAIAAAIDRGVIVMPATGRQKSGLPESFTSIPGVRFALTSNGGAVVDLLENTVLYSDFIDRDIASRLIDELLQIDAMVEVYHNGISYADWKGYERTLYTYQHIPEWFKTYVKRSRTPVDDLQARVHEGAFNIEKILLSFDDLKLRERVFERLQAMGNLTVVYGNAFNIEINSPTATKGSSLLKFAADRGIRAEEIMACGDTMNDRTMMAAVGWAVAMGNADAEIKAMADYVTCSNDEDGVAHAIERFVLSAAMTHQGRSATDE